MGHAETIKGKIESLVTSQFSGRIDDETARWLTSLGDKAYAKLVRVGLAPPRETQAPGLKSSVDAVTLGRFLDEYTRSRVDVKPGTRTTYGRTCHYLLGYFDGDRRLSEISEGDADAWRLHLLGRGLSVNTVNRACGMARQFFRAAVRRKLIVANPFDGLQSSVKGNRAREFFVTEADIAKVLVACPNVEWRLIVALARYGGLRTPSETLLLRWSHIDWEAGKMLVHSPKTEAHPGGESRLVPLFPELRPLLLEAFTAAEPGDGFVIAKHRKRGANLRTHLLRIMAKAGVKPWPKLFQNMRSTRQTELCERWPEYIVCGWLGNSRRVAREHYLQIRDADFLRASEPEKPAQNPAQNPAQQPCAANCDELQPQGQNRTGAINLQEFAIDGTSSQGIPMGGAGFEPATFCV